MFEVLVILLILVGFIGLYLAMRQMVNSQQNQQIEDVVDKVFGMSASKVAEQSKQILAGEKETIKTDLDNKQKIFEKLVAQLHEDVKTRQEEIREIEQDRTKKFSELSAAVEEQRKLTDELSISTRQLARVLSNNQQRGEWGERIIEDLMISNGLKEGVQYARQQVLKSGLRPDITLLLPNERVVPVDVKFPYQEIQKMTMTEDKVQQQVHLNQFKRDIKVKIDKVAKYIDAESKTVDYAIMFVPNEMVYSFINQKFPDLVDEAVGKHVLFVSPFTFLIVARTVMESYRNFMIGDTLKEIVGFVDEFAVEWERFVTNFEKYGKSIDRLQTDYHQLTGTRVRQMKRRIDKINSYRQGSLLPGIAPTLEAEIEDQTEDAAGEDLDLFSEEE